VRQIIHLDLDAFYAAVEVLQNPELKGKPLIVSTLAPHASPEGSVKSAGVGNPKGRGVVSTASYEARRFGVSSAMPLFRAVQLCPQAVIVPVRHRLYSEYSRRVMDLLGEYSAQVEQVSIDEAYLEIAPDREAALVAREIQSRIQSEIGLDATVAVASNKLVAKIACNVSKPRGFIVIQEGQEEGFIAMLGIEKLPGAGRVRREKLSRWRVTTIGDLARIPLEELRQEFGKHGEYLHHAAQGRDDSPIVTEREMKSISSENTFERDTRDIAKIEEYLAEMSRDIARQLEREGVTARTIVLKLRYDDFTTLTRQTTLRVPTEDAAEIHQCVRRLLEQHWDRQRPVRLVGVGAHNLLEAKGVRQMEFEIK
jgi:nucleotidyltransferase/DNA polymerase involved in DNA repair